MPQIKVALMTEHGAVAVEVAGLDGLTAVETAELMHRFEDAVRNQLNKAARDRESLLRTALARNAAR